MNKQHIVEECHTLINAYKSGLLGQTIMPEDTHPEFKSQEERLSYFTLPMALNYQRDSYKLWKAALNTYNDQETRDVFTLNTSNLKSKLLKYKLALQPNKHIHTWETIQKTIITQFGSFEKLFSKADNDFLKLKEIIQIKFKSGFPYLSGPKIFNYWSFIMGTYGKTKLKNRQFIDIAPDTHITQCSIKLGVISKSESQDKILISNKWRELLTGSDIDPIDMHAPLWFWSRNGFIYKP
jgi:hypothetical protein